MRNLSYMPCLALALAGHTYAFQFEVPDPIEASLDMTVTYGAMWRLNDQSKDNLIKPSNGRVDVGLDDANRNFDEGLVSNRLAIIGDLELAYQAKNGDKFGVFSRFNAYYDDEIYNAENDNDSALTLNSSSRYGGTLTEHNVFHEDVEDRIGKGIEVLDLFVYANYGVDSDHPATLRLGQQVINWGESAFIQNGISAVINPADVSKASLPGTEVKEILRPLGALSGSISLTPEISLMAYYQYDWEETTTPAYGSFLSGLPDFLSSDGGENLLIDTPPFFSERYVSMDRASDITADDEGQWGLGLTWYVPELNDTEFGFYVVNYHRKLFDLQFESGNGTVNHNWIADCAGTFGAGNCPTAGPGGPGLDLIMMAADGTSYRHKYFEDIKLYGFSWNTVIPWSETAFSGEIAYHNGMPQQRTPASVGAQAEAASRGDGPTDLSQRENVWVVQMTFNQDLNALTFADDVTMILEAGWVHVAGGLSDGKRDVAGNYSGDLFMGSAPASRNSWGYRMKLNATWYDAFNGWMPMLSGTDLKANLDVNHDVEGTSSIPGTGFNDNKKAVSLGLEANWQDKWTVKVSYTDFFGSGRFTNGEKMDDAVLGDRDNIALTIKYRI